MPSEDNGNEHAQSTTRAFCAEHPQRVAEGTCARCGNFHCQECTGRREGTQTFCKRCRGGRAYVAWEDITLGTWQRYFATVKASLTDLPKFAADLPANGGLGRPLTYALAPTLVSVLLGSGVLAALMTVMMNTFGAREGSPPYLPAALGATVFVSYGVMGIGSFIAYLTVWPAVLVGVARVLGNQELRYEGLVRILCYASGFNFAGFIPFIGMLAMIYHLVLVVACIAAQGRTSIVHALAIYGGPAVALGTCCCGSYVALVMFGMHAR